MAEQPKAAGDYALAPPHTPSCTIQFDMRTKHAMSFVTLIQILYLESTPQGERERC